jgi:hypothetical protein
LLSPAGRRLLLAALLPAGAHAQAPQMVPGLDNYALPDAQPTSAPSPVTPPPLVRTVPPRPSRTPDAPRPTPAPPPAPTPPARPAPTPSATPSPVPGATPSPRPAAPGSPTPTATSQPPSGPVRDAPVAPLWPWLLGAGLVIAGGSIVLGAQWLFRRRDASEEPAAEAAPPSPPLARARLSLALRPVRAGLNILSATAEAELRITNTGEVPAHDIRAGAALLAAGRGLERQLTLIRNGTVSRPIVPPFTLAPGETRTVRAVGALGRDAIEPLEAGARPMLVPVLAVMVTYTDEAGERRVAEAHALGVERVDSPKLAPLWLDAPPRMYEQVGARQHGATVEVG